MADLRESFASAAEEKEMQRGNDLMQRIEEAKLSQNAAALLVIREGVTHLKTSLANHMSMYIAEASPHEAREMATALCTFATNEVESVQIAYGSCIKGIATNFAALWPVLHRNVWDLVVATACQCATIAAMESWSGALAAWSTHLSPEDRKRVACPWIERNISSTNPIVRILACHLFDALAAADGVSVVDSLWEAITRLRSDSTPDVALAFVSSMRTIRVVGGVAIARVVTIPCLLEHVCHPADDVACAVLKELVACRVSCVASQRDSQKGYIPCAIDDVLPRVLLGYLVNGPPNAVEITLAEKMGELLHDGGMLQIDEAVTAVVVQYCAQAHQSHNVAFRRWIAFNFPAILVAVQRDAPHAVPSIVELHYQLALDPCDYVRLHIAAGFHEVVRLTTGKNPKAVDAFHSLIGDASAPVKDRIFANTPTILQHLLGHRPSGSADWKTMTRALLPHMASYGTVASSDWRKLRQLFRLFDSVNSVVTAAELHSTFIPLLLKQLSVGATVLKAESANFLARAFAATTADANKPLLIGSLSKIVRFGASEAWQTRVGFVHIAAAFSAYFSPKFISTFFQAILIKLATDPIPSVVQAVLRAHPRFPAAVSKAVRAALPADITSTVPALNWDLIDEYNESMLLPVHPTGPDAPPAVVRETSRPIAVVHDEFMYSDAASIDKVLGPATANRKPGPLSSSALNAPPSTSTTSRLSLSARAEL